MVKDESGRRVTWRVGRRRLAWRPRYQGWFLHEPDEFEVLVVLNAIPLAAYLLNWAGALLATAAVWPWRAVTGRWPVVAYPTTTGAKGYRTHVRGRRAADALAQQWQIEITENGQPRTSTPAPGPVTTG